MLNIALILRLLCIYHRSVQVFSSRNEAVQNSPFLLSAAFWTHLTPR